MIYTEKDLIDFGNYLLSDKRIEGMISPEARICVNDTDLDAWRNKDSE